MPLGMLGKYERLDVLGHGVSGIVYLARDTLLNKQVALKEVDIQAGDVRRFLEEARVMDRLRHPNIVRVNGVDRIDGKIVIDMEFVRGENLQNLIRREGRLSPDRALEIAIQVLDALDYAHRMQTVHRDIKPANILIARDGTVKLVDFGLAEILATNAYAGGAGTYAYMAPEDFAEEDRSDHQSDIWAAGVTLYEMLTENRPFQVERVKDPFAWKRALETAAPTPLDAFLQEIPPGLQTVLDRALSRSKRDRFPSAADFRDALRRLQADLPLPRALRPPMPVERLDPIANGNSIAPAGGNGRFQIPSVTTPPVTTPPITQEPGISPRTGPEVVVAEVLPPPSDPLVPGPAAAEDPLAVSPRSRLGFRRRDTTPRLLLEPERLDFGTLRKGETRTMRLVVRVQNIRGDVEGRVLHPPGWLTVDPGAFSRATQSIAITAHSARVWETGEFVDRVRVETAAGVAEVPARLVVRKPRPGFLQVAPWYVPLFASALSPLVSMAMRVETSGHKMSPDLLAPSATAATGLLAVMLLLIAIAADIGIGERIACGVVATMTCFLLGAAAAAAPHYAILSHGMSGAAMTGFMLGAVLLLQLLYFRRWKLWAVVLVCLGLLISGVLLSAEARP